MTLSPYAVHVSIDGSNFCNSTHSEQKKDKKKRDRESEKEFTRVMEGICERTDEQTDAGYIKVTERPGKCCKVNCNTDLN